MNNYDAAVENVHRLFKSHGGTKSWRLDQLLALAQVQATLAVAEALRVQNASQKSGE